MPWIASVDSSQPVASGNGPAEALPLRRFVQRRPRGIRQLASGDGLRHSAGQFACDKASAARCCPVDLDQPGAPGAA